VLRIEKGRGDMKKIAKMKISTKINVSAESSYEYVEALEEWRERQASAAQHAPVRMNAGQDCCPLSRYIFTVRNGN
jgi:hypothetical protein